MSRTFAQLGGRVWNTALLLEPTRGEVISNLLLERIGIEVGQPDGVPLSVLPPIRSYFDDDDEVIVEGSANDDPRPYQVRNGIALLYVSGELVNKGSWIDAYSGLTSYKTLEAQLLQALADPEVVGILLDIDSPGGEAAGCMELGALVREISKTKPVTAFVDGQCCSAAYAIACGAGTIVSSMSATIGSIGVMIVHMDRSGKLAKDGLKPTIIQKGAYKSDGTSLLPLADDAKARIDALLETLYTLFVKTVSDFRPSMSDQDVRDTEAGVFIGAEAVAVGLADRVGTFQDALATLSGTPGAPQIPPFPEPPMSAAAALAASAPPAAAAAPVASPASIPAVAGPAVASETAVAVPAPGPVPVHPYAPAPPAGYAYAQPIHPALAVYGAAPTPAPQAYQPPPGYALVPAAQAPAPAAPAAPPSHALAAAAHQEDPMVRVRGIMNHPEAVGREEMAKHLALETGNSVEAAAGILSRTPRAVPGAGAAGSGLIAEMSAMQAPHLGPAAGVGAVPVPPAPAAAGAAGGLVPGQRPKSQWDLDMEEGARTARELGFGKAT